MIYAHGSSETVKQPSGWFGNILVIGITSTCGREHFGAWITRRSGIHLKWICHVRMKQQLAKSGFKPWPVGCLNFLELQLGCLIVCCQQSFCGVLLDIGLLFSCDCLLHYIDSMLSLGLCYRIPTVTMDSGPTIIIES